MPVGPPPESPDAFSSDPRSVDLSKLMDSFAMEHELPNDNKNEGIEVANPPTEEEVVTYERLVPMLRAAHREMSELSKKKQDGIVNTLKIRNINRLLVKLESLLKNDPSKDFVELLDEESLPQNSDVVLLLSLWQAALTQYRNRYYGYDDRHMLRWFTVENPGRRIGDYDASDE